MKKKNKRRLLFCTETGDLSTGYGNYTRSVLQYLYNTNKYIIAELSCFKSTCSECKFPWKIYPNAVEQQDERFPQYAAVKQNQFGQWRFDLVAAHFKPDIVIDFRDMYMSLYQRTSIFRSKFHWILAPTIDSFPMKREWIEALRNCDTLLTHTEWAKTQIESKYNIKVSGVVKDSIDPKIFKPMNKAVCRQKLNMPLNIKIIGSVMRNQRRKLIPELFRLLSDIIQEDPDVYLYLHTSYPENNGWEIPELLLEFKVYNNVLFSYVCDKCKNVHALKWQGESCVCPSCSKRTMTLASANNGVEPRQLAEIINTFNVYVQYSVCEGFGIPPLEAAACGVPFITTDHGAMTELAENFNCDVVKTIQYRDMDNGSDRVFPDNTDAKKKILDLINMNAIDILNIVEDYKKIIQANHSWDITGKEFEKIIDNASLQKTKNRWLPLSESYFDAISKDTKNNSNNREFVYDIVDNILQEPQLKTSYFIETLVSSLDKGYVIDSNGTTPYNKTDAVKTLEMWFNNKVFLNGFIENPSVLKHQDFLDYK